MTERKRNFDDETRERKRIRQNSDFFQEYQEIRFDFRCDTIENDLDEDKNEQMFDELLTLKDELNRVKTLLSDKDIDEWSRHTTLMNRAATIVPFLRENLHVELATIAWAKFYEILVAFDLLSCRDEQKLTSLHLCEAPGGFISALNHFLTTRDQTKSIDWQWFAQTLNPYYEHDPSISAMLINDDRLIFQTIDQNRWDFGSDNTGNLLDENNLDHYIKRFQPMNIDFITADGSFNVQENPAEQELLVYPLVKCELFVALSCLRAHGNFLLKLFTTFERKTIELINLLYQTFSKISFFKPLTSKRGNSEVYVVCQDFHRAKWIERQWNCRNPSNSFLSQLLECSKLFQKSQIQTIQTNLFYFRHDTRRFRKILRQTKEKTFNRFVERCQIEPLNSNDRHLFDNNRINEDFYLFRRPKIEFHSNRVDESIRNGSFCFVCSKIDENYFQPLCSKCETASNFLINRNDFRSDSVEIGRIFAERPTKLNFVFGRISTNVRNSCFCDSSFLQSAHSSTAAEHFSSIDDQFDLSNVDDLKENEKKLIEFSARFGINLRRANEFFFARTEPILSRLQASTIYFLTSKFQITTLSVVLLPTPHLFFHFQHEIPFELPIIPSMEGEKNLLQFVDFHQLFDEKFALKLVEANHFCLGFRCLR